jgi:hypothetical protein
METISGSELYVRDYMETISGPCKTKSVQEHPSKTKF